MCNLPLKKANFGALLLKNAKKIIFFEGVSKKIYGISHPYLKASHAQKIPSKIINIRDLKFLDLGSSIVSSMH